MIVLAIDPGTTESAYALYEPERRKLLDFGKVPNHDMLAVIATEDHSALIIERIESYGMPVGREVFDTVQWTGRFIQAADPGRPWHQLPRREVKLHLCGQSKAKDANVRQALLDRFHGPVTPSGKPAKGHPLRGVSGDVWAALAVAVTWADRQDEARTRAFRQRMEDEG